MDTVCLSLSLTPHGRLVLTRDAEAPGVDPGLAERLQRAFERGAGPGLLLLGADEAGSVLPAVHSYWRDFGVRYVTALCTRQDSDAERSRARVAAPPNEDLERMVLAAPPMLGAEYLTTAALGAIHAYVCGSELYKVDLKVALVEKAKWKSICGDCAGAIDSLVELLQGRLSKAVMERICRQQQGLFPTPAETQLSCSCPDWAGMGKHIAAVLYGIGARFDQQPELLFRLRQVDEIDLIAQAGTGTPLTNQRPNAGKLLGSDDLSGIFGLDMAQTGASNAVPAGHKPAKPKRAKKQQWHPRESARRLSPPHRLRLKNGRRMPESRGSQRRNRSASRCRVRRREIARGIHTPRNLPRSK